MRRFLLWVVTAGLIVAGFVCLVPVGPGTETFIDIAPGTSSRQVALALERQHLIRSRYGFDALRLMKGGALKAGEYRFDHPATLGQVYSRLLRGDVYTRSITVPEGANLFDIAERVEAARLGTRVAFLKAAQGGAPLVRDLDPAAASLEGYLFPDTYHFSRTVTAPQMVAAMVKRFRQEASALGLSAADTGRIHKVVTLASLVERETPIAEERPLVASVFTNRLAKGMPLMTDPTVIYAALLEGRYRGAIYQSDLAANSAYNTYKHAGLPPGPICNPGLGSLRAAMSPAKTDFFYFVAATADPSGRSRFSTTLEEQDRNVASYRRAEHDGANGSGRH